jgi:NDP-sugar pyrophosphorylase family protein
MQTTSTSIQAILLAAGAVGAAPKLWPLTERLPAALLPLANRPVMLHAIELLARSGVKRILVSMQAQTGQVEAYFGAGQRWGVALEYVLQRDAYGAAGALKWAERLFTGTFIVMPADAWVHFDLAAAVAQHRACGSIVTVVQIQTTAEAAPQPAGVYICEPQALAHIPARTPYDIAADLLPALWAAGLPVHTYSAPGVYSALATFAEYQAAQEAYLHEAHARQEALALQEAHARQPIAPLSVEGQEIAYGIWVGKNHLIHPTARLAPPVSIGANAHIGRDVELGPGVVLGDNVIVDDGASLAHSTVLDNSYVGRLVRIEQRIIHRQLMVNAATGVSTQVMDRFLLDGVEPVIFGRRLQRALHGGVALLLLILLLPLLLLLGTAVWLTTGRLWDRAPCASSGTAQPAPFALLRFATQGKNGRGARLGAFLQRTAWQRLPELWNVVRGDLLLVGVKPLTPAEAQQMTEPWQKKCSEYPPGFTGLWFIRQPLHRTLDEALISDAYYVATRSWRSDLELLWQTPRAWWTHL